jgi:hypothetical protein
VVQAEQKKREKKEKKRKRTCLRDDLGVQEERQEMHPMLKRSPT